MFAPRFSIVIPTRDRPDTLEFTLRTCLAQDCQDLELIVSDNFSPPQTRELIEKHSDPRLRYVRTPALLAMTDSLEFAVAQAKGQYVIVLGDDDGLLGHALPVIDQILRATNTPVLRWDSAVYNWPNLRNPHFQSDTLLLPLSQSNSTHSLHVCNSSKSIQDAVNGAISYADLPIIFASAIRRDLLQQLRSRTGRIFKTRTPDVYSALAVAAVAEEYYSLRAPLGICGRSGNSTGVARHFCKKGSPIDNEFRRLNARAGYELHPWVPDLPPIASAVADAFLWAKQDLFPNDGPVLDRRLLIHSCVRAMEIDTEEEWLEVLSSCRQALIDSPELLQWFEQEYACRDFAALSRPPRHHEKRYGDRYLYLNTAEFGVRHIDDAAILCERILGYKQDGLRFQIRTCEGEQIPLSELQEKEAVIQRMSSIIQDLEARYPWPLLLRLARRIFHTNRIS